MNQASSDNLLTRLLADRDVFAMNPFRLLDIGCSGGIENSFRHFGKQSLHAVGIDPNMGEVARLQAIEDFPLIQYIASFCGLPAHHPFVKRRNGNWWGNNPWSRLSTARAIEILATKEKTDEELTSENAWARVQLADSEDIRGVDEIVLREFAGAIDFLKVDVDGADLAVLHSASCTLESPELLGLCLEVNYHGTDDPTDNTFHNMDRMMRKNGFELFALSTRHYSSAALPSPFLLSYPAQTRTGRILQGDAIYLRDPAQPNPRMRERPHPTALLKLACLFEIFGLPDCSAELIQTHRDIIQPVADVDRLLNVIAQSVDNSRPSYSDYISTWETRLKAGIEIQPVPNDAAALLALTEEAKQCGQPLIIWGYGVVGKLIYPHLTHLVRHVVDSSQRLVGTKVGLNTIAPPESLTPEILRDHVVIFTPQQRPLPQLLMDTPECRVLTINHQHSGIV